MSSECPDDTGRLHEAESWTSVVEWSEMKLEWLRQYLPFANDQICYPNCATIMLNVPSIP
jgi:hypothetical protein